MNKKYFFTLLTAIILGSFIWKKQLSNTNPPAVVMPGAGFEEGRADRRAWEKMMLADPTTGEIPRGIRFAEQKFARQLAASVAADRSGADWTLRGPWNVGGRTRSMVLDVTNPERILAGGVSSGIWLSEDGGKTWSRRTPYAAHPGCVSIAQDPRPGFTNIWYYLSGEIIGTSASGGGAFYLGDGMFKSTDGGKTWASLASTDGGNPQTFSNLWQSGWRVVVNPTNGDVFAATYSCIFRSNNGGNTWTEVLGGIGVSPFSYFTDVAVTSKGVLYATFSSEGARKGIWRSTNGTNWTNITPANFPVTYDRIVIGINPNNEDEVYFLGETPKAGFLSVYIESDNWTSLMKYKYLSGDGAGAGGEWTFLSQNLPKTGTEFDRFAHQGGYDLMVKVQPGTGAVFVGGTNLWRSTDGFTSPNNTTKIGGYAIGTTLPHFKLYPNHHPDQHDVVFHPTQPNWMFSASDGGLHLTKDCLASEVVWESLNNGYQTTQFYTAIFEKHTAGDHTLIGGLQDNGNFFTNSTDPTAPWKLTVNGDGAFGHVPQGKPYYILSIQQGRLVKCSIDNEGEVKAFQRFDPIGRTKRDYLFINPFATDPSDENILYLPAGNQFYRQSDLASIPLKNEWDSIATGWTRLPDTLAMGVFSAIGVSKSNPSHTVYLGTNRNRIYKIENAHTGTPTWTALNSPLPDAPSGTQPYISCIAVDPDNGNDVTLVFSNYNIYSLWRSLDGGSTWKRVGGNLESNLTGTGSAPSLRWLEILPSPDGSRRYFCGTSVGLYSTAFLMEHATGMPGTVWIPEGASNIGSVPVPHIQVRPSDGWVVAATHGHGMFSAFFPPTISQKEPKNQVKVQVSPNPTSDFVVFSMSEPPADAQFSIRWFDVQGKLLKHSTAHQIGQRVQVHDLPHGYLLYEIQGVGWRASGKLLKQ